MNNIFAVGDRVAHTNAYGKVTVGTVVALEAGSVQRMVAIRPDGAPIYRKDWHGTASVDHI